MNGEILFLAHRTPYPPDRGDKIRSYNVLKGLAQIAPVHVGCLAETADDQQHETVLGDIAASICMPRRTRPMPIAGVEALFRGEPVSLTAFRSSQLQQWVRHTLATRNIAAIYVFSGQMGQFVPHEWEGRLILDLVDVDSAKFEAYGQQGKGPRRWIDTREGRLLRAEEARLAARADITLLVSEAEAQVFRQRAVGNLDIRALSNGIDCVAFDPASVQPHEFEGASGPHIVFTGQMDYAPNIAAVTRMANSIMPLVRNACPQAQFHIVGRAPTDEVQALHGVHGTDVVGEVADVRPWLAAADMVVAPLTIARGIQNKVLEAMAMECAVIASPEAATGIEARDDIEIIIAQHDEDFVSNISALALDHQRARALGKSARLFVQDSMSWPAMLAQLPQIVSGDVASTDRSDAA